MSGYFSKPKLFEGKVKKELDIFNYATKAELKNGAGLVTLNLVKKVYLANLKLEFNKLEKVQTSLYCLKSKVDKLDIGKCQTSFFM